MRGEKFKRRIWEMKERIRTCALVLMMFLVGPQVSAVLADGGPEADFSMSLLSQ